MPQRWFLHFYVWGGAVNAAVLTLFLGSNSSQLDAAPVSAERSLLWAVAAVTVCLVLCVATAGDRRLVPLHKDDHRLPRVCVPAPSVGCIPLSQVVQALLLLALFQLHLLRRALETALLLRYPPGARMHGVAYLFGMRCA